MALIDKASLLMVPSTYEDGTLYNVLPTGNKAPDETGNHNGYDQTRADFTFSRGSNLAATRVNASGLIEKGRENLLKRSNEFDNGGVPPTIWNNNNSNETSGQEGYDGTNNAWKLTKTASGAYIRQNVTGSGVFAFSVYAKASNDGGDSEGIYMLINGNPDAWATFDLNNGTTSLGAGASVDSNIEEIGSGWYRCSLIGRGGVTDVRIYPTAEDGTYTNTSGAVFIQSAQLEKSMVATDYIETGSTTAQAGILEDMPRINYDANGENGALLLEPQRTNLVTQSEYFGAWTNDTNTSLTPNAIKSPSGFVDAYKMSAGTSSARQARTLSLTASGNLVFSTYAKKGEYSVVQLTDAIDGNLYANFDLENGVLGNYNNCTPSIEDAGNDWYRCIITWTAAANINKVRISIAESKTQGRLVTFAGNGTDGIYIYGAQLEAGSYSSSLIPTHGAAVTRGADNPEQLDVTGLTGTYNTIYAEISIDDDSSSKQGKISLSNNTQNNRMTIYHNVDDLYLLVTAGGTAYTSITHSNSLTVGTTFKVAAKKEDGKHALFVNGVKIGEESSTTPTGLTKFRFGNELSTNSSQKWTGGVKQTMVFDSALTDAECVTLTTL